MERYEPKKDFGLTQEQVANRISEGLVNFDDQPKTKSIKQIIASNFFTYFNFLNIALGAAVLTAGIINNELFEGLKNCLFMGVIIINSIISIVEEIISKKIIDRLSVISESKVTTIREGKKEELSLDELVLDDVTILTVDHQIVADSYLAVVGGLHHSVSQKRPPDTLTGRASQRRRQTCLFQCCAHLQKHPFQQSASLFHHRLFLLY